MEAKKIYRRFVNLGVLIGVASGIFLFLMLTGHIQLSQHSAQPVGVPWWLIMLGVIVVLLVCAMVFHPRTGRSPQGQGAVQGRVVYPTQQSFVSRLFCLPPVTLLLLAVIVIALLSGMGWLAVVVYHWILASGTVLFFLFAGLVIVCGLFARHLWAGVWAIHRLRQDGKNQEVRRRVLLAGVGAGHSIELSNTVSGELVKTTNPIALLPAGKQAKLLSAPHEQHEDVSDEEPEEVVEQPTVEEIVAVTPRNTYQLGIGRSLTSGEFIFIDLIEKHLKLIGASRKGKSAEAGAIMRILSLTHDPNVLQFVLLDLEYKTSKLFEDLPHIATHTVNGKLIRLIARSREEVLQHLKYLVAILDYRATLPQYTLDEFPITLVYLEELIALKDYFKKRIKGKTGEAKEAAEQDYADLIYCIGELARRGLKYHLQLLVCTQCDYRDDDLVEAWINIGDGLSFAVRPSAAQAAGFRQIELLNENYEASERGQFVCEVEGYNDIGIAPYFPLKDLVKALEQEKMERERAADEAKAVQQKPVYARPYLLAANGRMVGEQTEDDVEPVDDPSVSRLSDEDDSRMTTESVPSEVQSVPLEVQDVGDSEDVVNEPVEQDGDSPQTRQSYPLMNETQKTQFMALYPLHGIEKSLDQIKGCSHKHREHARALVREYSLQRVQRSRR